MQPPAHITTVIPIECQIKWPFIDEERWLCAFMLDDGQDALRVDRICDLGPCTRPLSDDSDLAAESMRFPFDFQPSSVALDDDDSRPPWHNGIRVDVDKCASLGMSRRFRDLLSHGSDLLLDSLPTKDITRATTSRS